MIYYIKYNSLKLLIVDRMFLFYEVKLQLYRIKKNNFKIVEFKFVIIIY